MPDISALNLQPGQIVGGYLLVAPLGSGAMGSVWRVQDGGGNEFAMKILRDSLTDANGPAADREQQLARERLRREGTALRRVDHPGVCHIVDMELDDSLAFIVTELIKGLNLFDDVERNGRYEPVDLMHLAERLIDAVDAVHAAGIIHRDIKPTNVMVSDSGPVLVDFGIAMGEGESHVTRTGLVMGTPGFIAPEIIDGAEADEATDWWSLAAVLGFAGTGQAVFGTKPLMTVLEREASGHANLAGLPPRTQEAMRSALDPDRMRRCSAQELLQAITADALHSQAHVAAPTQLPAFPAAHAKHHANSLHSAKPTAPAASAASAADAAHSEAMPPFGMGSSATSGARATWRDSAGTIALPTGEAAKTALEHDAEQAEQIESLLNGDFENYDYSADYPDDAEPRTATGRPTAEGEPTPGRAAAHHGDVRREMPDTVARFHASPTADTVPLPPLPGPGPASGQTAPDFARNSLRPLVIGGERQESAQADPAGATTPNAHDGSTARFATPAGATPAGPVAPEVPADTVANASATPPIGPTPGMPAQPHPAPPGIPEAPGMPAQPAPYDSAHYLATWSTCYSQRSTIAATLIGITLVLLAASFPGIVALAGPAAFTAALAIGFGLRAAFRREARHEGKRIPSDAAWSAAGAPWRLVQGAATGLIGCVMFEIVYFGIIAVCTIVSGPVPTSAGGDAGIALCDLLPFPLPDTAVLPVPLGESNTPDALGPMAAAAAGWIAALSSVKLVRFLRGAEPVLRVGLGWPCVTREFVPLAPPPPPDLPDSSEAPTLASAASEPDAEDSDENPRDPAQTDGAGNGRRKNRRHPGSTASPGPASAKPHDRSRAAFALWAALTAVLAIAAAAGIPIEWAPFVIAI